MCSKASCAIENFEFIVCEQVQVNPDNSWTMSMLTFSCKLNTLHKETLHWNHCILGKPDMLILCSWMKNLTFQNRYSPSSCFLYAFENCIINKRIEVCTWEIVKLWVSRSHGVMTVVCWIYTTITSHHVLVSCSLASNEVLLWDPHRVPWLWHVILMHLKEMGHSLSVHFPWQGEN